MSENCLFEPWMVTIVYIDDRTFFGFFLLINAGYKTSAGCICFFDRGKQAFLWFKGLGDSSRGYANGVNNTQHIWYLVSCTVIFVMEFWLKKNGGTVEFDRQKMLTEPSPIFCARVLDFQTTLYTANNICKLFI